MKKPTTAQVKEFWKKCGVKSEVWEQIVPQYKQSKDSLVMWNDNKRIDKYPPIDLNSLFRYAVPKLQAQEQWHSFYMEDLMPDGWRVVLAPCPYPDNTTIYEGESKDPADALFWACYKAFGLEEV